MPQDRAKTNELLTKAQGNLYIITWVIHIDWGREAKYYYELATMNGSLERQVMQQYIAGYEYET